MDLFLLKSKIHRAVVTQAELNYVGSITIDKELMEEANIHQYEKVQIVDIDNGQRFETYVIEGEKNSGVMCINGAAARCVQVGDKIIIMTYCIKREEEAASHNPIVVLVNENNKVQEILQGESHGDMEP
ncbi:MAG: aspartate 1-decarboxylase [Lachnospiraceae bacterium]